MKDDIRKTFEEFAADIVAALPKIVMALLLILLFIALGNILYKTVGKRIRRKWDDTIVSGFTSEAIRWGFYFFGVFIALNIVGFNEIASGIIAGAGISAIILGFAFKDIGENFLSGILLALNRPFEIGDIIEIKDYKGTIKHLDLQTTHIRSLDGKDIYIPNATMIKDALINYTRDGLLRISFVVGIAPEANIETVRTLILGYLKNLTDVQKTPGPGVVVKELGEFTTDILVFYWIDLFENRQNSEAYLGNNIRSVTIEAIKKILDENGIEMPSQVLELKMNRDHILKVRSTTTGQD